MSQDKMKRDLQTPDYFEVFEVKAVVGGSSCGAPQASSSRAVLTEKRPNNDSENLRNMSPVFTLLQKQGERTDRVLERQDRVLDLFQNQARTLEHYGVSMKTQVAALTVQGEILKQHSDALGQIIKDQHKLRDDVNHAQKEVGRQGSILKQQETRLKRIEGRVDKLCKGHHGNGNLPGSSDLRRSTRIEASKNHQAGSSRVKYQRVECTYCDKTLSKAYVSKHTKKCPVLRQFAN